MSNVSTIIVTEDDVSLNNLMQKILQREGFKTEGALSGAAAIEKFSDCQDSLLLLDYSLPDMTGREVIEALSKKNSHVPFVLVTGAGNENVAVDMMKRGAIDYIIKDDGFVEYLPDKIRSIMSTLNWEKSVQQAEETLQQKASFNQLLLEGMPYIAILMNPLTNEILASNAAAYRAGVVSGNKCICCSNNSDSPCPWCAPPVKLENGSEYKLIFEADEKIWDAIWMAIDDDMLMLYASDVTDRGEMLREFISNKKDL
jgi:FixJ family two-component response regulator